MFRAAVISVSLFFAVWVLTISVFRTSSPKYAYYQPSTTEAQASFSANVDYNLPNPGVGPDNPLWILKAVRDRILVEITFDPEKRGKLLLFIADKRLSQAYELIEKGDSNLGVPTAEKAEQYLLEAQVAETQANFLGTDTAELALTLAKASLKHREVLEKCIAIAPDDAKPVLSQITDTPKQVYEKSVQRLNEKGIIPPISGTETPQTQ